MILFLLEPSQLAQGLIEALAALSNLLLELPKLSAGIRGSRQLLLQGLALGHNRFQSLRSLLQQLMQLLHPLLHLGRLLLCLTQFLIAKLADLGLAQAGSQSIVDLAAVVQGCQLLVEPLDLLLEGASYLIPSLKGGDVAARQMREFAVKQAAESLGDILIAPLAPIAVTLLYYDLRVRREGLDIEAQAAVIGYPLAPDPAIKGGL
jgi:hypothetical protein